MRSSAPLWLVLVVLLAGWAAPVFSLQEPPPSEQTSRELTESLKRAFQLISEGQFKQAKTELDRAAELAGGPCGECLLGLSHVYASEKKWSEAADAAQRAIPLLTSPSFQARAYNQLGVANVMLNTPETLARAAEALRQGAALGGAWGTMARYNLAEALFRNQSWAEAAEAARGYLQEAGPDGTASKEARVLLCRARAHLPDEPSALKESAPAQSGEEPGVLRVGGKVTRPEIISQVRPAFPERARRTGAAGTVLVEAIIDQEGCVRGVKALKEQPDGLTEAALEAVREWVFSPATLEGSPVKAHYVLSIDFSVMPGSQPPRPPGG